MSRYWNLFCFCVALSASLTSTGCCEDELNDGDNMPPSDVTDCTLDFSYSEETGCDGQTYLDPSTSPFIIPFEEGFVFKTGLTNCSASYHGSGQPDQYAFDFDLPVGTSFLASRAGTIVVVVEDQNSNGGGVGNYVIVDHLDQTFGAYYHSPQDGITVQVGDQVEQGQSLGVVGRSGLAGYPHLHFTVLQDSYNYPYNGIAISFSNVSPPDVVLESYKDYSACE